MFVNIFKNQPNDVQVGTMYMEEFMKMEETLMEENENGICKIKLLEDDNIAKLQVFYYLQV